MPWICVFQPTPSFVISFNSFIFMCFASQISFNHLIQCIPLLLDLSTFPIIIACFRMSLVLIICPKYLNLYHRILVSSEISGLVSSITDLFVLLVVHGTVFVTFSSSVIVRMHLFFCSPFSHFSYHCHMAYRTIGKITESIIISFWLICQYFYL